MLELRLRVPIRGRPCQAGETWDLEARCEQTSEVEAPVETRFKLFLAAICGGLRITLATPFL
jgi:hypothetical protein